MRNATITTVKPSLLLLRSYTSQSKAALRAVDTLRGPLHSIDIDKFRQQAFIPENPILVTATSNRKAESAAYGPFECSIPAAVKWFDRSRPAINHESGLSSQPSTVLSHRHLSPFGATILPYEYIVDRSQTSVVDSGSGSQGIGGVSQKWAEILNKLDEGSADGAFHRFNAPLSLFLQACKFKRGPRLYIAQAQIIDLPKQMQDDLPTLRIVKEAGKGDIYDANLWMGIPPTYTPLHKDPNPNLFVQLAGSKIVRIFRPSVGASMFRKVQQRIGQTSSSNFRGEEMMEGPERSALDEAAWGDSPQMEGFEAIVAEGDALFIPKGWWHSVKSVGTGINASVNWWFR